MQNYKIEFTLLHSMKVEFTCVYITLLQLFNVLTSSYMNKKYFELSKNR